MPTYKCLTLRDCTTLITAGRSPSAFGLQYQADGIAFIRAEAITELGTIDASNLKFIGKGMHDRVSRSAVQIGDLLITISNAKQVKSAVISDRHLPANVNENVAVVRPRPHLLSPRFLQYYIAAATFMSDEHYIFSRSFDHNRTLERLEACEIPLPPISAQEGLTRDLADCDLAITHSIFGVDEAEAALRHSMDRLFGGNTPSLASSQDNTQSESERARSAADEPRLVPRVALDQLMEQARNKAIETASGLHPGQVLAWHDRRLLAIAEPDSLQARKIGLRATSGDVVIISTKRDAYYLATALIDCIAPPASLVLRTIKPQCRFLCLYTLLSPAFVRHAMRIAAEEKNTRPQWKFIRKYNVELPSDGDLEKVNSSLQPIYGRWSEAVQTHLTLKKRRTELLMHFWHELHPAR